MLRVSDRPALPFLVHVEAHSASMAVIVKSEDEDLNEEEKEEKLLSVAELKRIARDDIILDEATKGISDAKICEVLRQKGYHACEKTVWNVLHSEKAAVFLEKLKRDHILHINVLRAYALRNRGDPDLKALAASIQAEGQMIKYMLPQPEKSRVDVSVNVKQQTAVQIIERENVDFSKLTGDERRAILHAEEVLTRAETATGSQ